ncbi:MAG TPA: excinuclease ABC subunit UvrC [Armatimonadota bacterium]|nr:excinuclease ABC subunit UvrC [Armatimonadota bacterium]
MEAALREKLKHLPDKPGVYMMKDVRGEVLYVGKASSLRSRVRSYFQKGRTHQPKLLIMMPKVNDVDWLVTGSELEALMLECNLIKQHHPRYNVCLRDDKHYPYLCVTTSEPFPRVLVVRRVKQDGNRYFGPYGDSSAMRESLRLIRRVFRIRGCNKKLTGEERDRPCLNFHLGQCESPCSGRIAQDAYRALVRDTCSFLEGRGESLVASLEKEMGAAAEALEFERAARLRDQTWSLRKLVERQKAISTDQTDRDIVSASVEGDSACVQLLFVRSGRLIGEERFFLDGVTDEGAEAGLVGFIKQYYRDAAYVPKEILVSHALPERAILEEWLSLRRGSRVRLMHPKRGVKRRLVDMAIENAALAAERERSQEAEAEACADLQALAQALGLPEPPSRIEAYDISNIQGREAVGSMVVFQRGLPAKSQYRRFKIRAAEQPDDYGMIREVLLRRLARTAAGDPKFAALPDLVLIDGGRGQLNAALDALRPVSRQQLAASSEIRIVSLAKRLEEIYTPESSKPLLLPLDSPALRLLQRIRDEAHRFALAYHRKLRVKAAKKSVLDGIPGIGDQRRKALIRRFGSLAGVRRASLEELLTVPGMTRPAAETVYEALHGE